jgi:hypothetical protein
MVGWLPSNARRPSPGSWLSNWLEKQQRHPDAFLCGIRVRHGTLPGVSGRWRFRVSAVDPLLADGVVTLHHGTDRTLRLHLDEDPFWPQDGAAPRPGHTVLIGTEVGSAARVLVSVPHGELVRFGIKVL